MRTETDIKRRLTQRRFRHQKKYLSAILGRVHSNCRFNARAEAAHGVGGGVCTHPDLVKRQTFDVSIQALIGKQPQVILPVCDAGSMRDRAKNCERFESRVSKDRAKSDFKRIITEASEDMNKFSAIWPDMAQLIWVLNPGATKAPPEITSDVEPDSEDEWDAPEEASLELRAPPGGAHLLIGESPTKTVVPPNTPMTTDVVALEHAGYLPAAVPEFGPKPEPAPEGWFVRLLRWALRKAEGDG